MKLNYAPQADLRRRRPDQRRELMAFCAGLLILAAFELVLMSKSWSPATTARIFDCQPDRADAAQVVNDPAPLPDSPN
jgi:hypothetical protein